jgi:hypothetical protein
MDCEPSQLESILHKIETIAAASQSRTEEEILWPICDALNAEIGCLLSPGRESSTLTSSGVWFRDGFVASDLSLSSRVSPVAELVRNRASQAIERPSTRSRLFRQLGEVVGQPVGPTLVGPLTHGDSFGGVLLVARVQEADAFTSPELEAFESLASVTALAKENQSLKEELPAEREAGCHGQACCLHRA